MRFLILLLTLSSALAKDCDFTAKGVTSPPPVVSVDPSWEKPTAKGVTSPPPVVSVDPSWEKPFAAVYNDLCHNLKTPNFFFRGYRAHPGPPYNAAYLWDTAFITQVWMHWDPFIAEELIHYLLRFQKKSGLIHHAVVEILLKPYAYNKSQPPLLGWASKRIYQQTGNRSFLEKVYPDLKRYHEYMRTHRRHRDGLYFWWHAYESGIDNSPRFSNQSESFLDDTKQMAAVDLASYMAMDAEALSFMARELGHFEDEIAFAREYEELKILINEKHWSEVDQAYLDWDYRTKDFIRANTISNFTPLAAGIPDAYRARLLMDDLLDPEQYNTKIPFPSVARNEKSFVKDMWRGPVWINMAYLVIHGMSRYQRSGEAAFMAKKLISGVFATWDRHGHFYEFYDPDRTDIKKLHRKKGNLWKKLTLGSKPVKDFIGWTGLVNTLVIEFGDKF